MSALGSRRADLLAAISKVGSAYPCSCCKCLKKDLKVESARFTVATESFAARNEASKAVIKSGVTSRRS